MFTGEETSKDKENDNSRAGEVTGDTFKSFGLS